MRLHQIKQTRRKITDAVTRVADPPNPTPA